MKARGLSLVLLPTFSVLIPLGPVFAANPPDKNLEAALRELLNEPKKEFTDEMYARVYHFVAMNKGIRDLTGLEKCKNLREMRLVRNEIKDLKPLAGLAELQSLDLGYNEIADLK